MITQSHNLETVGIKVGVLNKCADDLMFPVEETAGCGSLLEAGLRPTSQKYKRHTHTKCRLLRRPKTTEADAKLNEWQAGAQGLQRWWVDWLPVCRRFQSGSCCRITTPPPPPLCQAKTESHDKQGKLTENQSHGYNKDTFCKTSFVRNSKNFYHRFEKAVSD